MSQYLGKMAKKCLIAVMILEGDEAFILYIAFNYPSMKIWTIYTPMGEWIKLNNIGDCSSISMEGSKQKTSGFCEIQLRFVGFLYIPRLAREPLNLTYVFSFLFYYSNSVLDMAFTN